MKYKALDNVLSHDGAAICERLDAILAVLTKLAEQQDFTGAEMADWRAEWRDYQGFPRLVRDAGPR